MIAPHAPLTELSHLLTIDVDANTGSSSVGREPRLWILVVEWPWRDDSEEGEGGASEANVQRELNVLGHEADKEGDNLFR